MKKLLLLLLFISSFLNAVNFEITCQNQGISPNTRDLPFIFDSEPFYDIWGDSNNLVEGSLDVVNNYVNYWSNESAVCGGSLDANIFIEAYCDDSIDSSCWDVTVGIEGVELIIKNEGDGLFYNNVIYSNGYPCLPKETTSFTIGLFDSNTGEDYSIPFQNAHLNTYVTSRVFSLTTVEADTFRNTCEPVTPPYSDYSQQLDQIIKNTSDNSAFSDFLNNDLASTDDSSEDDLLAFELTFQKTLDDAFLNYSDVFGFSGYGPAPSPISFALLGQTFEVFNISIIDTHVDLIRATFSIFAYLWGIIIVFRSV